MDEEEEEKKEMVSAPTGQATNKNGATTPTHNMGEDPIVQRLKQKKLTQPLTQKKLTQPLTQKNATQGQSQVSTQTPQQEDEWSAIDTGREAPQKNLDKEIENVRKSQDEERVKEAKKQRNRQIINSIADGISAIANLGGTVHGAPDMSTKSTLTGKSAERYDKIYKDAEERRKNYLKIVQDQGNENIKNWYTSQKDKLASKQKQQEINIKAQAEARQLADMEFDQALAKAKEERDEKIHALDVESKTYDNDKKKIDAEFARQKNELEAENLKARKRYYDALTGKAKSETDLSRERVKTERIRQYKIRTGSGSNAKDGPTITVRYNANGDATYQISGKYVTKAQVDALAKEYGLSSSDIDGDDSYNWDDASYGDDFYVVQKGKQQNKKPY